MNIYLHKHSYYIFFPFGHEQLVIAKKEEEWKLFDMAKSNRQHISKSLFRQIDCFALSSFDWLRL